MQQIARVQACNSDGTAVLTVERESACSGDCHRCAGCGAVKQTLRFTAVNAIGARAGELVTVSSSSAPVLAAAAVLYVLPVALFFLGYLIGGAHGALVGGVSFCAGIALAVIYDRLFARKRKTVYTITGYADSLPEFREKGDNDLD